MDENEKSVEKGWKNIDDCGIIKLLTMLILKKRIRCNNKKIEMRCSNILERVLSMKGFDN